MKKALSVFLATAMLVSMLAGCTGESKGSGNKSSSPQSTAGNGETSNLSAPGEFPIVKEKVTLKVAVRDQPYTGKYEETDFFKWFEEKTNIHIEFNELKNDAVKEKVNLLLVSGDLPDVFLNTDITKSMEVQYGSRGVFLALNDLVETQGIEIKKMMAERSSLENAITAPDGNIYALPMINDCFHCQYEYRSWINQSWLTKLNLEIPNTTAEFEKVLQAFKDGDPNGNGKKDEFPMMGAPTWADNILPIIVQPFVYPQNAYLDDNKKVTFSANTPEYKEAMLWGRSLIEKGLLDPTSLTQTDKQLAAVMSDPNATLVGVPVVYNPHARTANNIERIKEYVPLPPLEGPNGVRGTYSTKNFQPISGGFFVITDKCKTPEAAFRWADAWYSEEATKNSWIGLEGKGYVVPTSGVGLNGEPALWESIIESSNTLADPEQKITAINLFGNNTRKLREGQLFDETKGDGKYELNAFLHFAAQDVFSKYGQPDKAIPPLYWLETESAEYSSLNTQITDYVKEQSTLFLLGEKSIEKDWDNYVSEFNKLNLDKLITMVQTAYDRQYK